MNQKDLDVWKKGMELVERVYAMSEAFPDFERFGIPSQKSVLLSLFPLIFLKEPQEKR